MTTMRFGGRGAIVTGGARGIGAAIAHRLAHEGARVALWDIDAAAVRSAAAALGPSHLALKADVSDEASVAEAARQTAQALGRIDLLVNNAGILGPVTTTWEHAPHEFRLVLEVNLTGTYLVARAIVPRMLAQEGPVRGRIVNMSSIQAKEGMPQAAAYAASKAGVVSLTKTLGKELASSGILVNCLTPAAVETDMARLLTPERRAEILARIPMGRFVAADEVAAMVAFLGSDDCTFSTGAVFDLSGGRATY
ncbi:MAG TPA: SDR family NAD(P)-dependent oxidoreductase [Xanthobacteraceae bacterium]|nr:SDR family NAD(P)-dependent oxidoreductase [Xanthobacteraceae bacterium]